MAAMESDGINSSMQACKHEALRPLLGPAATAAPAPPVMSKAAAFDTEPLSPPTWHTPCYACGGSPLMCCLGACAPMVLFGMNRVEMADGDKRRFLPACCAYTSIALTAALAVQLGPGVLAQRGVSEAAIGASALACSVGGRLALAGYASAHRCAMRASEGLPPAPCSDFWLWCCCPLCANCQEGAQMEVRREAHLRQAGIEAAMVPPAEQRMQYK